MAPASITDPAFILNVDMDYRKASISSSNNTTELHGDFDHLFTIARPHILEMICLSLDYKSFKNCPKVNKAWRLALNSETFQRKAKSVFKEEIKEDGKKLLAASEDGDTDQVRKLLSIGLVDVDMPDTVSRVHNDGNWTPLHFATRNSGHKGVVHILLDNGANPNIKSTRGCTPLHVAAECGSKALVKLFLDYETEPNITDERGYTALHVAVEHDNKYVVEQLLADHGTDPNVTDARGCTPLHYAAQHGYKDVVQLLLRNGANPNATNNKGKTPFHLAPNGGNNNALGRMLKRAMEKSKEE